MDKRDALRDELLAVLRASRELQADADGDLAETFVDHVIRLRRLDDARISRFSRARLGTVILVLFVGILGPPVALSSSHNAGRPLLWLVWFIVVIAPATIASLSIQLPRRS